MKTFSLYKNFEETYKPLASAVVLRAFQNIPFDKSALYLDDDHRDQLTVEKISTAIKELNIDFILYNLSDHALADRAKCLSHTSDLFAVPVFYLVSEYTYFYNFVPGFIFYPCWLFKAQQFAKNVLCGSVEDLNRRYKISCANRNMINRPHRLYNLIRLLDKPYQESIKWTAVQQEGNGEVERLLGQLDREILEKYNVLYPTLPPYNQNHSEIVECITDDVYTNSYVNLVTETYYDHPFASEKPFKAFLAGQIPMVYGAPGINQFLADLGFDLFADIVDYASYDNEPGYAQCCDKIMNCLDQIVDQDLAKLFIQTQDRRCYNQQYISSDALSNLIYKTVEQQLMSNLAKR